MRGAEVFLEFDKRGLSCTKLAYLKLTNKLANKQLSLSLPLSINQYYLHCC